MEKHNINNISSLIFDDIILTQNNLEYKIKILADTNVKHFEDNNYYLLRDKKYNFLVHLSQILLGNSESEKVLVKPIDTYLRPFRIKKNEISIFGKILFMSSLYKV